MMPSQSCFVTYTLPADEKKRTELLAVREGVTINEIYSRMLSLFEREHGRVELAPVKDAQGQHD